jgi:adenylyltransferase/sulfurtransferase
MSDRHSRHHLFKGIGIEGQAKLARARVVVVGCGALGSRSAELLARAGVGTVDGGLLRLIDRDYVDVTNLQRQALYTTSDAAKARPKATAAEAHIAEIDPGVRCQARVRELTSLNATDLLEGAELILDGTDNFRTRFLINDAAISLRLPWIYAGAVGSRGVVSFVAPGITPCFRCLLEQVPPFGVADSCDTAGIITPLPSLVASIQVSVALKFLVSGELPRGMMIFDAWQMPLQVQTVFAGVAADPACRSCGTGELPALTEDDESVVTLCGRNSVQVFTTIGSDLDSVEGSLARIGVGIQRHEESVTAGIAEGRLTVFRDGRVIVEGTTDPAEARTIIARYIGG